MNINRGNSSRNESTAIVTSALTFVLAGVFVVSGMYKWSDPAAFQVSILHLDLFPEWMVWPLVLTVPLIEVLAGLMCLTSRFGGVAMQFLLFLTAMYTLLLLVEWLRGIGSGCGCFGSHSAHWPYWALFARNFGLLFLEAFLLLTTLTGTSMVHADADRLRSRTQ